MTALTEDTRTSAGLRERKKATTRAILAEKAIELCLERGYSSVTVSDIADAAGVSRRTFSNYFANKAECLASAAQSNSDVIIAESAGLSAYSEASSITAVQRMLRDVPERFWIVCTELAELMHDEPELEAYLRAVDLANVERAIEPIAIELGVSPENLTLRVAIGAIANCIHTCIAHWVKHNPDDEIADLLTLITDHVALIDLSWLDQLRSRT